jgi:hypothetical protein
MMKVGAVVFSFLVLGCAAAHAATRMIYIDPISNNGPASWNNMNFGASNNTAVLNDTLTQATGIRATVTRNMNPGANGSASTSPTGDAAEFAPAGGNSAYGHTTDWGTSGPIPYGEVLFSSLSTNTAYHFTFYASRTGVTDNREALYTLTGANSGSNTLNASGNSSFVTTVSNLFARADGTITLRLEKGAANNQANGFFYLTAMKVVYEEAEVPTEPERTTVYVDAAGTSAAAGWNRVSFTAAAASVPLFATNGTATGIGMQVTTPLPSSNTAGTNNPTGSAAEFMPAGVQNCFGHNASYNGTSVPKGVAVFSGLNTNVAYTFTFYASRMGATDDRSALYALNGANSGSNTLNGANNYSKVCVVSNIYPQSEGTITLEITKGPSNNNSSDYFYIAALKLTFEPYEAPEQSPIPGKRLLFFGNSFSMGDDVPGHVGSLAALAGHPAPLVAADLLGGTDLAYHITQVDGYPANNVAHASLTGTNTWDHVIIQGYSTEATHLRDTSAFRTNALALFRRVRDHASGKGEGVSPVLFQTWARAVGHTYYPVSFAEPAVMQLEIRTNYQAAAEIILAAEPATDVRIAPVGDAFERGGFNATDLYGSDLYHAGNLGPELAALVLYKTIYETTVTNIPYAAVQGAGWTTMSSNDWTRVTYWAEGLTPPEVPPPQPPPPPRPGSREVILVDPVSNNGPAGWNNVAVTAAQEVELTATNGLATAIRMTVVTPIRGPNNSASAAPSGDAAPFEPAGANTAYGNTELFSGGVAPAGELRFSNLSPARRYTFTFYGSRVGADVTDNRETLYTVTGANSGAAVLDAALNSTRVATVAEIAPDANGTVTVRVEKGPNNTNVYGFFYLTAFRIESQRKGTLFLIGP